MYDHVIDENIFPSFVCSCIPQIDMMSVLEEVHQIKEYTKLKIFQMKVDIILLLLLELSFATI